MEQSANRGGIYHRQIHTHRREANIKFARPSALGVLDRLKHSLDPLINYFYKRKSVAPLAQTIKGSYSLRLVALLATLTFFCDFRNRWRGINKTGSADPLGVDMLGRIVHPSPISTTAHPLTSHHPHPPSPDYKFSTLVGFLLTQNSQV